MVLGEAIITLWEGVARRGWRVGECRLTRFLEEGRFPNRPYRNDRGGGLMGVGGWGLGEGQL